MRARVCLCVCVRVSTCMCTYVWQHGGGVVVEGGGLSKQGKERHDINNSRGL